MTLSAPPVSMPNVPVGAWDCHAHVFGPWHQYPLPPKPAYVPDEAPLADYLSLHARLGITHGVLVQPACYGDDHAALLGALEHSSGHYRGIALIAPDVPESTLALMHARGIRGVRFNVLPHLPGSLDPAYLSAVVARIRPYGWHVLVHGQLDGVLKVLPNLVNLGVPVVIDHLARVRASDGTNYPAFRQLEVYVRHPEVWIKLSGADRISDRPLYDDARAVARRLLALAPERALWGTDWPHPNITYPRPDESQLLALLWSICDDDASFHRVLVDNPARLYS